MDFYSFVMRVNLLVWVMARKYELWPCCITSNGKKTCNLNLNALYCKKRRILHPFLIVTVPFFLVELFIRGHIITISQFHPIIGLSFRCGNKLRICQAVTKYSFPWSIIFGQRLIRSIISFTRHDRQVIWISTVTNFVEIFSVDSTIPLHPFSRIRFQSSYDRYLSWQCLTIIHCSLG